MLTIPEITALDMAFGNIKHMPKYDSIPDEYKDRYDNQYCRAISKWFFCGARTAPSGVEIDGVTFKAKEGIDHRKALAAIQAVLASFEPKHEHKTAACAYMLSQWFDAESAS